MGVFVRQAKFARANLMPVQKIVFHEALKPGIEAINAGRMSTAKALETSALTVSQFLQQRIKQAKALRQ